MNSMIWRVNLDRQVVDKEPVPETWQRIGGRGLVARVLLDEVPPMCDALGPSNKLLTLNGSCRSGQLFRHSHRFNFCPQPVSKFSGEWA